MLRELRVSPRDYAELTRPNYGLNAVCDQRGIFVAKSECRSGVQPKTLVWGDSFAMHIVPALMASPVGPMIQATMSGCAPALDISQFVPKKGITESWARDCIGFNRSVLQYILTNPEISTVVIASQYSQILGDAVQGYVKEGDQFAPVLLDSEIGLKGLLATARAIRDSGRRVIFVGPTPSIGVDMAECLMRREVGLLTLGANANCTLPRATVTAYRHLAIDALEQLKKEPGVTSAMHMRRALAHFEVAGLRVTPAATDHAAYPVPGLLGWLPDAAALEKSGRGLKELVGVWVGR